MTMEVLADWVSRISNVVWNGLLLYLLVGTGIVFTIRTRFVQVRKFGAGWKHLFGHFSLNGEKAGKDGMSPFQALTTAIAAQVGTGNIAGAATALYSGGPGAIFWMWLSAFFGMSTIYGEAVGGSPPQGAEHGLSQPCGRDLRPACTYFPFGIRLYL